VNSNVQTATSVFIIENHDVVRRMLAKLIDRAAGLTLCGESASAEEALLQIADCRPDLALVDISLPGIDGIKLIHILHEQYPHLLMLAVSGHDESIYALPALRAGARGYVMKGHLLNVVDAIRHVRGGDIYVSEKVRALLDGSA
jgi:DNA-binding NarL/FixJ family response regulator